MYEDKSKTYEVTEVCPHCESENTLTWNTDIDGYEIYCPHCGNAIMLCDECMHSFDNVNHFCDWSENDGCWRKRKKNIDIDPKMIRDLENVIINFYKNLTKGE